MRTVKAIGLLVIGIFAFFLAGCFNPVGVVPSNTEAASRVEPFSVDVFIGPDAGTRSVAGPSAARVKDDIRNIVQLIVTDNDGNIVAFDEVRRQRNADTEAELSIDSLAFGQTYNFLLLMGHWERTYTESVGQDYIYTDKPPTLLAAGLKTQAVTGSGKVTVTMWPIVADTVFTSPVAPTAQPVVTAGKPEVVSLLPVDWDAKWTIQQGVSGNGLSDLVRAQKIPNSSAGDILQLQSAQTLVRVGGEAWSSTSPNGNIITQAIGTHTSGFVQIGTNGSVNFKLEYIPYNLTAGGSNPWTVLDGESVFDLSGNGVPVWIIRNGVNDLDQDANTDFNNFHNIKENGGVTTANGNGAVRFVVEPKTPGGGGGGPGGSTLVVRDGVFVGPSSSTTPDIRFTTEGYTGTAEGYYAVVTKGYTLPVHSAYTGSLGSLAPDTHTETINLPGTADYDVYVIIFKDGAVSDPLKINTGSGGSGVNWIWGDEPYLSLYVASTGNDGNSGTKDSPLATVQTALVRLKTAYAADSDWPGKGDADPQPAEIIIVDTVNVAEEIYIDNSTSIYPNIILRDDEDGGTLQATASIGSGKSLLKLQKAKVTLTGSLTLAGIMSKDIDGVTMMESSSFTMDGGTISGHDVDTEGGGVKVMDSTFTMNNGVISDNHNYKAGAVGGGVYLARSTFIMNGGKIHDNEGYNGGGVALHVSEFFMNGGEISYNSARFGGGVNIYDLSTFTMSGGKIHHNEATEYGGGVHLYSYGTFILEEGEISFNFANKDGGGIGFDIPSHYKNTLTITGGKISGNSAGRSGAGIGSRLIQGVKSFTKTGGIIYGYTLDDPNSNKVIKEGVIQDNKGHAVYIDSTYRKETTLDVNDDLFYDYYEGTSSGW